MAGERNEVHVQTEEARGGSTPHVVRWILGIGLFLVIAAFTVIVLIGGASQGDLEEEQNVSNMVSDVEERQQDARDTDGVLIENADELETGDAEDPLNVPNQPNATGE